MGRDTITTCKINNVSFTKRNRERKEGGVCGVEGGGVSKMFLGDSNVYPCQGTAVDICLWKTTGVAVLY